MRAGGVEMYERQLAAVAFDPEMHGVLTPSYPFRVGHTALRVALRDRAA